MGIGESIVAVVAVVLGLAIPLSIVLLPAIIILGVVWLLRKPARTSKQETDETRLIQEIHHGLERMEQRIEVLETLVLDDCVSGKHEEHTHRTRQGV